ncbi:MAG: hypothetical protein D6681_15670 [Calditrichaeota bacterium]|nr:MAG: hypothetical protein D6681_15670 [Calditrichota bacterium]
MSWISEVRSQIQGLSTTLRELRQFGLLVGGVFMVLAGVAWYRGSRGMVAPGLFIFGVVLMGLGAVAPLRLRPLYQVWMGLAFALGWIVSRILLTFLFYLALTPIAFIARLSGKRFLDTDMKEKKPSYWIPKSDGNRRDYRKMY